MNVTSAELSRVQASADKLRDDLSVVSAELRAALDEVEVWKSKAEEAREVSDDLSVVSAELRSALVEVEVLKSKAEEAREVSDDLSVASAEPWAALDHVFDVSKVFDILQKLT